MKLAHYIILLNILGNIPRWIHIHVYKVIHYMHDLNGNVKCV